MYILFNSRYSRGTLHPLDSGPTCVSVGPCELELLYLPFPHLHLLKGDAQEIALGGSGPAAFDPRRGGGESRVFKRGLAIGPEDSYPFRRRGLPIMLPLVLRIGSAEPTNGRSAKLALMYWVVLWGVRGPQQSGIRLRIRYATSVLGLYSNDWLRCYLSVVQSCS